MLYRNGDNLKNGLIEFLSDKKKVTIFSPYIKSSTLKKLLRSPGLTCEQIVVRWEPKDLAMGSSDLDVYNICKKENITLYMNNRIHLKLFTNNFEDAFLGSANISERAISDDLNSCNYEVCSSLTSITRNDRLYLNKIINESTLVTDEIYSLISEQIPKIDPSINNTAFKLSNSALQTSDFLITKLPMIDTPELFWDLYSSRKEVNSAQEENCFCHDTLLYKINKTGLQKDVFFETLATNFFGLPFISSFLQEVDSSSRITRHGETRGGLSFGAVRRWFSGNTTTAPAPRAFELTSNVRILYAWIESLSDKKYSVTIPGEHSQVIKRN
ncbi:MAG: hypothetical protein HRO68_10305 [Nitrosopumilus sp.]|nr:hypothetical protein [Nitrosopumilus sp.]